MKSVVVDHHEKTLKCTPLKNKFISNRATFSKNMKDDNIHRTRHNGFMST